MVCARCFVVLIVEVYGRLSSGVGSTLRLETAASTPATAATGRSCPVEIERLIAAIMRSTSGSAAYS